MRIRLATTRTLGRATWSSRTGPCRKIHLHERTHRHHGCDHFSNRLDTRLLLHLSTFLFHSFCRSPSSPHTQNRQYMIYGPILDGYSDLLPRIQSSLHLRHPLFNVLFARFGQGLFPMWYLFLGFGVAHQSRPCLYRLSQMTYLLCYASPIAALFYLIRCNKHWVKLLRTLWVQTTDTVVPYTNSNSTSLKFIIKYHHLT